MRGKDLCKGETFVKIFHSGECYFTFNYSPFAILSPGFHSHNKDPLVCQSHKINLLKPLKSLINIFSKSLSVRFIPFVGSVLLKGKFLGKYCPREVIEYLGKTLI